MTYLAARRKDGTLARIGDRVLLVVGKNRHFGTITEYHRPIRFHDQKSVFAQTYKVRCDDKVTRPCRAQSTKGVYLSKFRYRRTAA